MTSGGYKSKKKMIKRRKWVGYQVNKRIERTKRGSGYKAKKMEKVECGRNDDKKIERSNIWSNLPDDIVSLIFNSLYYVDQIRFRAVCKNWRVGGNSRVAKYADKLPWTMAYNSSSCFLYNPYEKRQYTIDTCRFREVAMTGTNVLDSKNGWVLFATCNGSSIFFFNPFSNKIIRLPEFFVPNFPRKIVGTFSVRPDSPDSDCLIYVIRSISNMFCISLCKLGDTEWTDWFVDNSFGLITQDVEYVDEVFYCSFDGCIGAFNATLKKWDWIEYPESVTGGLAHNYVTHYDGGLLISRYDYNSSQVQVLKCDTSQWDWCQVESLGNRSLFLGKVSMCLPLEEEEEEEVCELANKIYQSGPPFHIPLSLVGWLQCRQSSSLFAWMQYRRYLDIEASQSQRSPQIYDWEVPAGLKKIWIQPPQHSG